MGSQCTTLLRIRDWAVACGVLFAFAGPLPADPFPKLEVPAVEQKAPETASARALGVHEFVGSQSCAAASCHGNPDRTDLLTSAYHVVMDRDPHLRAGVVLYSEESAAIMENLGDHRPAWKADQCLVCHAPSALQAESASTASRNVADGVGCESCHGAAAEWISAHRSYEWNIDSAWPADRKQAAGFVDTKNLSSRIRLCAGCHIGEADRQVNHDLIAAGHPRLTYEFTAYHAMLPPHWSRRIDQSRLRSAGEDDTALALKSWLLGQLVTADGHLQQIEHNAADPDAVFPDLAHSDCYACHHDLADSSWRQGRATAAPEVLLGQAAWGTWTLGLLRTVPEGVAGWEFGAASQDEADLRQLIQSYSADRPRVVRLAGDLRMQFADSIDRVSVVPVEADAGHRLAEALLQSSSEAPVHWDQAVQLFLAMAALQHDPNVSTAEQAARLDAARRLLAFEVRPDDGQPAIGSETPRYESAEAEGDVRPRVEQLFREYLDHLNADGRTFKLQESDFGSRSSRSTPGPMLSRDVVPPRE